MTKVKDHWVAAVCYDAQSMAKLLRETLEELNFKFEREKIDKHYSRTMIVIPLPQFAYVFRFRVTSPSKFIIDLYDTKPTHSGILHFVDVQDIAEGNLSDVKTVLKGLAAKLPRKPWQFFWAERFKYAFLAPEYVRAKRQWGEMGVT
jgi:hypothetical protein